MHDLHDPIRSSALSCYSHTPESAEGLGGDTGVGDGLCPAAGGGLAVVSGTGVGVGLAVAPGAGLLSASESYFSKSAKE